MKLSKQLEELLAMGHRVAAWRKIGGVKVFTLHRSDNYFEGTFFEGTFIADSIDLCISTGLTHSSYSPQNIDETFTHLEVVPFSPRILPVDTKVRVLENLKDVPGSDDDYIGKTGEISDVMIGEYAIGFNDDDITYWLHGIPYHCVAPVYEEKTIESRSSPTQITPTNMTQEKQQWRERIQGMKVSEKGKITIEYGNGRSPQTMNLNSDRSIAYNQAIDDLLPVIAEEIEKAKEEARKDERDEHKE